jgi:hypothetical protein
MVEFFMVLRENRAAPISLLYSHESDAAREAERLARNSPGDRFFVMRSVASVVLPLQPVEWKPTESQPEYRTDGAQAKVEINTYKDDSPAKENIQTIGQEMKERRL